MKQDYVTFKCLSTKIDRLCDGYQDTWHNDENAEYYLNERLIGLIDGIKDGKMLDDKLTHLKKKRSPVSLIQLKWEALCYMLEITDIILYQRTGFINEFLDLCATDDDYFDRRAEYDFKVIETKNAIEFTYEYEIEYPENFSPKLFETNWAIDGIEFKSYNKMIGKDVYECRVSVSKEGFDEIAREIIDGGELDHLREKTMKLF